MDNRYFIRNDDVGARTPALVRYVETFLRAELPVSYQVIPVKLTAECARWLSDLQSHHPNLIEFGQHGLRHEMILRGKSVWREFGPERTAAQQLADIRQGKDILEDALGAVDIFTPPQHKYDRNTLVAAYAVGHRIFSAASYRHFAYQSAYGVGRALGLTSLRHHGLSRHGTIREDVPLLELSISIAIDNGGQVITPPAHLAARLNDTNRQTSILGVMMHHEVYGDRPALITQIADVLTSSGVPHFGTLTALAGQITKADSPYIPRVPTNTTSWG